MSNESLPPAFPTRHTPTFTAAARTLNTPKIIGLIIGAMTPLAVLVGTIPLGLVLGGPSLAWAFIAVGVIVGVFCVGYAQMVRRINRPGAFYNYIARGLGRPVGVGAAMIAAIAYPLGIIGAFAVNSVLLQGMVITLFGVELPWQVYVLLSFVIIAGISYFGIDLSAIVVFVVVMIEVAAVAALAIGVAATDGLGVFSWSLFSPEVFQIGAPAVAFVFAFLCFQGYEAGALYAPEAKRPEKTVPRALFIALVILVVVHVVATWTLTAVTGVDNVQSAIEEAGIGVFVFQIVETYLGPVGTVLFSLAVLLSVMAIQLAIVNFMSRYINTLAAEDLLPRYLARRNRWDAPGAAILTLSAIGLVVIFGSALIGLDPLTQLSAVAFGIGAVCATVLMALASIAVVAYFARKPKGERGNVWATIVAPAIAAVLLITALVIQINGFPYITNSTEPWLMVLPFVVLVIGVAGFLFGLWIKAKRPLTYADLAAGDTAEEAAALRATRLQAYEAERAARLATRP